MQASSPLAMQLACTMSRRALTIALHKRSVVLSMAQKGVRAMGSPSLLFMIDALWLRTISGHSVALLADQTARDMVPLQPSPVRKEAAVGQYTQGLPVQSASRGGCLAGGGAGAVRLMNRRSGCSR